MARPDFSWSPERRVLLALGRIHTRTAVRHEPSTTRQVDELEATSSAAARGSS